MVVEHMDASVAAALAAGGGRPLIGHEAIVQPIPDTNTRGRSKR